MKLSLNGTWDLYCIEEKDGKNPPFGRMPDTQSCLHTLEAQVPGNAQLDMHRAGITPDPFYGDNYYEYIRYEHCSFAYCRTFMVDEIPEGEEMVLRFDGIDTVADVFLNGEWIGHPEDMFVEHEWKVTDLLRKGENSVIVCI